ncbi:MAG: fasciclin domain-containing protein [Chitinophagaceae bacterium]|nr:fasciclin domain-containing protein [Chitinophagaceae bacterium]
MKKYITTNIILSVLIAAGFFISLASCNKKLEEAVPITFPKTGDTTIGGILNQDTTLSIFRAAALRVGVLASLMDNNNSFTAFIPNNAAFRASGIASAAVIGALPITSVGGIVNYAIIPGEKYASTDIPTTFPNLELPSSLTIGTLPGTPVPIKLPIFPSRRSTGFWANNIPVVAPDQRVQNGIIHRVAVIVAPPSLILAQIIYGDPKLSLFSAAIARGDSGQVGLNKIDSAIRFPLANLTVFAPTDTAIKKYISAATGGLIPVGAPNAVFVGFINTSIPARTAQGLVAYHFMGVRAFSVNFPTTAAYFPTLLNGAIPSHPGVLVQATIIGGFGAALTVTGVGNGGLPAVSTAPVNLDKNAVNGVVHVIDRLLLPQ